MNVIQPSGQNYNNQFLLEFEGQSDLMGVCDAFTIAKMVIKMTCLQHEYVASFMPKEGGESNHLNLALDLGKEEIDL